MKIFVRLFQVFVLTVARSLTGAYCGQRGHQIGVPLPVPGVGD